LHRIHISLKKTYIYLRRYNQISFLTWHSGNVPPFSQCLAIKWKILSSQKKNLFFTYCNSKLQNSKNYVQLLKP
jgi:hypothetical protein